MYNIYYKYYINIKKKYCIYIYIYYCYRQVVKAIRKRINKDKKKSKEKKKNFFYIILMERLNIKK